MGVTCSFDQRLGLGALGVGQAPDQVQARDVVLGTTPPETVAHRETEVTLSAGTSLTPSVQFLRFLS